MILTRKDYYSSDMILYNIIPQLKNKYLSVMKADPKEKGKKILIRYYMGYSIDTLKDSFERNNVLTDESVKIYYDLSTWINSDGMTPIFSFNKIKRAEERTLFSGNPRKNDGTYINLMKTYDFAIDIDSKNLKTAWKDASKIKEIFDKYQLPYQLKFSGSKGFHFCINAKYITTKTKPINRPTMFGKIVENIANDERLKNIDMSIYDARRILKLAYSLCNNDGIEYVALPLSDEQFRVWEYSDMRMLIVMKNVKLFKRGLLERNYGLSDTQLKANVNRFIKDYK